MTDKTDPHAFVSFRDPIGNLFLVEGRVIRIVNTQGQEDLEVFMKSQAARRFLEKDYLVKTWQIDPERPEQIPDSVRRSLAQLQNRQSIILEHEKIPFQSYPYEWAPEMLYAAGELTLDLAEELARENLGLKDATPYNILFRGPKPVFVDFLSFERRDPHDPTWLPYAQYVRTFLLPLQAVRRMGIHLDQMLIARRDGIEPEDLYRWLGPLKRLRPPCLTLVTLPTWLAARRSPKDTSIYKKRSMKNPEQAAFVLRSVFRGLRRALARSRPIERKSTWSGYMAGGNTYSEASFKTKEEFVETALKEFASKNVLDIGCNTGHFSMLAARQGAKVVAIDYDPVVIGQVWLKAAAGNLDILPLVVNITRPTPALGWNNVEHPAFLRRACGSFDMVMMLAVLHHMLVTERVPLPEILTLASQLTNQLLILEYVDRTDSMFQALTRGRDHLHADFTVEYFEAECRAKFDILRCQEMGTRRLYLLRKK